jgi:hypothetical protein
MRTGRLIAVIAGISLVVVLLTACDDGVDTDPSPTATEATTDSAVPSPAAACTTAAVDAVVRAELDPDGTIPGSAEIAECRNGYARVFYRPDSPSYETEQLFLLDDGGQWAILTYGTGIDCANDTDFQPPELEDACKALGLRP